MLHTSSMSSCVLINYIIHIFFLLGDDEGGKTGRAVDRGLSEPTYRLIT